MTTKSADIISKVKTLLEAYKTGKIGDTTMPEDTYPLFSDLESKRIYYTLPMALNYQRNSYKLWKAAKQTYQDQETNIVFTLNQAVNLSEDRLRKYLSKYKLALQPNKHIDTWSRISHTIYANWNSISNLIESHTSDYLKIRKTLQKEHKKGFPYLSGPKIFNYWMYIMSNYGDVKLKNRSFIEIAPDTHVIQASVKLGIITIDQSKKLTKDNISAIWRELLKGTNIDPIDIHSPLWFWSRSGFTFEL